MYFFSSCKTSYISVLTKRHSPIFDLFCRNFDAVTQWNKALSLKVLIMLQSLLCIGKGRGNIFLYGAPFSLYFYNFLLILYRLSLGLDGLSQGSYQF